MEQTKIKADGQLRQQPALCNLETLLACEKRLNICTAHFSKMMVLRNPPELTESELFVLRLLQQEVAKARAGYHELQRQQEVFPVELFTAFGLGVSACD